MPSAPAHFVNPPARPAAWALALLYAVYVLAGGFGQGLALVPGVSITFWPPAGILVGTLLLNPRAGWAWWVAAGGLAELTCNLVWFHNPVPLALVYYAGNALEALTAAWLIGRFAPRPFRLESLEEVGAFVLLGAGVAPVVGATVIATTDALTGKHPFAVAWPLAWLGDGTGLLVSAPLTLAAVLAWRERGHHPPRRVLETGGVGLVLVGVAALAFRGLVPTAYLALPPVLWAAARFQLRGAAVAVGLVTLLAAAFTVAGAGEFADGGHRSEHAVMLQTFLGVTAASALVVGALSGQRQQAVRALTAANAELEARVDERKDTLGASEGRFRQAMRAVAGVVWEWDLRTGHVSRSDGLFDLVGVRPADAAPTRDWWADRLHPDDLARLTATADDLLAAADHFTGDYRVRHADGRWVDVWERGVIERDPAGRAVRLVGFTVDVTARKRAEEVVRRSDERFRRAVDAARLLVYEVDQAGGAAEAYGVEHIVGADGRDADLSSNWWHARIHPDDLPAHLGDLERCLGDAGCTAYQARYRVRHTDGSWRLVEDAARIERAGPEARRLVGTILDVTEREQAAAALQDADRRKDEFLATLAHELRNPLAPVRNAIQILRLKGPAVPELQWARDVIDRQMQAMTRLIDDLMDVSRINRGKIELKRERVDLARVVQGAVETSRPLIEAMGHELTVTLPPGPVRLDADVTRLAQVFLNLLNNAAKYTERGGRIDLHAERQGSDVVVAVRDTGIGIPADKLGGVFDLFSQVEGALERAQGGLGIGLSLVRRLVEMHGGSVAAASAGPGRGSTFTVRLPAVVEPAPPTPAAAPGPDARPTAGLRLLVVDDNRDAADSLALLLKMMGNDVRTAHDGEAAVAAAGEYRPQVVLCDIGLPKLNGYEVARRVRQESWGREPILIAVTGWGQEADRRQAAAAGFDHHMVKPVEPQALMKLLADLAAVRPADTMSPG